MKNATCKVCGKEFTYHACYDKKGVRKYCSKECYCKVPRGGKLPINSKCPTCGKEFRVPPSRKAFTNNTYCSTECYRTKTTAVEERFWKYVNKTDSCWLWTGCTDGRGYGVIRATYPKRFNHKAPRLSYEMHKGPIPEGLFICHTCDNPACVNPEHLFTGTHKENMEDMVKKGRGRKPKVA